MPSTNYHVVEGADPTVLPEDVKKLPPQALVIFDKITSSAAAAGGSVDRKALVASMTNDADFLTNLNTCQLPERVLSYFAPLLEKCKLIVIQREKVVKPPKEKIAKTPKIKEPRKKEAKQVTPRKAKAVGGNEDSVAPQEVAEAVASDMN